MDFRMRTGQDALDLVPSRWAPDVMRAAWVSSENGTKVERN